LISEERYEILKNDATFSVTSYEKYLELFKDKDISKRIEAGEISHSQEVLFLAENNYQEISKENLKDSLKASLPDNYDSRNTFPSCFKNIVHDQLNCGGCWAFATAINFSERFCFALGAKFAPVFSPQYSISCDKSNLGCSGGNRILAWEFLQREGTVFEVCVPFTSGDGVNGTCPTSCPNKRIDFYKYYPNKNTSVKLLHDIESVKYEIVENGPVTAGMRVYDDLYLNDGKKIYEPGPRAKPSEKHSVILVGYGVELGRNYFIIQNSWGKDWGNGGYFKMWADVCDIMNFILAGDAYGL
jgi:C1A family cysteine protease